MLHLPIHDLVAARQDAVDLGYAIADKLEIRRNGLFRRASARPSSREVSWVRDWLRDRLGRRAGTCSSHASVPNSLDEADSESTRRVR